ncbi:MAG TPA: hypothetical protein VG844_17680 [Terracidiphilus sp.]|nr:hypothetical protein [Terracidiphilus sp.]
MRIGINLATRPFTDIGPLIKRLRIGMGVLAVVAIALGFGLHALHRKAEEARARQQVVENQIVSVDHERQNAQAMMRKPENAQVLEEAQNLNQLFDVKAFSWTLAMEDLETTLPAGVQVTTLEPARDKTGHITVKLRVLGPRDKDIVFVQNLEHSHHFLSPRIVGESSENAEGAGQRFAQVSASNRVNFEIQADYNPPTIEELKAADLKSSKKSKSADADQEMADASSGSSPGNDASSTPPASRRRARIPYDGVSHPPRPRGGPAHAQGVPR